MADCPIVFLDFDGVLNNDAWIYSHSERGFAHIDPSKVELVNQLIERTDANVVVSSAWRILHKLPSLRRGLKNKGFSGKIVDVTDTAGRYRGDEIQRWLTANGHVGPFVILDDNTDMAHLLPFLVKTDPAHGLTQADVDRAVGVLEGGENRG